MSRAEELRASMGPYTVQPHRESFYLSAPKDRLTNTATTWSIPIEDGLCLLAALDQLSNPPFRSYVAWEARGRPYNGEVARLYGDYPASVDGVQAVLSGPARPVERVKDGWGWNSIRLGYDAVAPLRVALEGLVQAHQVRKHATAAIRERLGHDAPEAILSCERDPDTAGAVLLHVNSALLAIECRNALKRAGYRVEDADCDPSAPGNYRVRIRILSEAG
ncbi:hypothetical protein [Nonomuraea sp. NPDC049141]|uniref:hypothetical protein n=1 Tax=Nonomuraea sp. NPDC049141 TaxID=3155500 RepID=UPI0033E53B7B